MIGSVVGRTVRRSARSSPPLHPLIPRSAGVGRRCSACPCRCSLPATRPADWRVCLPCDCSGLEDLSPLAPSFTHSALHGARCCCRAALRYVAAALRCSVGIDCAVSIAFQPALYSHIPGIQQPYCVLLNEVCRCDVEQSAAEAVGLRRLVCKLSVKQPFVADDAW